MNTLNERFVAQAEWEVAELRSILQIAERHALPTIDLKRRIADAELRVSCLRTAL